MRGLLCASLLNIAAILAEVITFRNGNNLTCVLTDESVYSALYIRDLNSKFIINVKRPVTKVNLTFEYEYYSDFIYIDDGPITDIRFENFERTYEHTFIINVRNKFVSVWCPLHVLENNTVIPFLTPASDDCNWEHYFIDIFGELSWYRRQLKGSLSDVNQISIDSPVGAVYSTYGFWVWTFNENKRVEIDLSGISNITRNLCISMFVVISKNCYLDVMVDSGNKITNTTIKGFHEWKRVEITIDEYNGTSKLIFVPRKSGYFDWIVDFIHICKPKIDIYHHHLNCSHDDCNFICKTVEPSNMKENIFCNKTGYVGKNCNISYMDVLGSSNKDCKNYKICSESGECKYLSEYGKICNQTVKKQYISTDKYYSQRGMKSATNQTLEKPNNVNDGKDNFSKAEIITYALVLLLLLFLIVFILGFTYYRYKRCNIHSEVIYTKKECSKTVHETKVLVENFDDYMNRMAFQNQALFYQFEYLQEEKTKSCEIALQPKNSKKNRDNKNIPYDSTRVILTNNPGTGTSNDYINASYLNGIDRPKVYIVSQGPKLSTVTDFWWMIWQEEIETIAMITDFVETDQRMCAEYWIPTINAIFECGALTVRMINENSYEHYDSRTLEVHYGRHRRQIRHFNLKWVVDEQNPIYPNDFVPFIQNLHSISGSSSTPILVHSSSGNNRAGTIILCDLALHMAQRENQFDIYQLLKDMRDQRPHMINKKEYYLLAHLIVLEVFSAQRSPYKSSLEENLSSDVLQQQINYVKEHGWNDKLVQLSSHKTENKKLLDFVVADYYKEIRKFVVLKQPPKTLIKKFWYTVSSENIKYILLLNPLKNKLWPYANQDGPIVVRVTHFDSHHYVKYTFHVLSVLNYDSITKEILSENEIHVFELRDWKSTQIVPSSTENILDVVCQVRKTLQQKERILLNYGGNIRNCSLVVALFYLLEKYEKELEFDVYKALRLANRSNLSFNEEQLKFLYTAFSTYLKNFDKYQHVPNEV